MKYYKIINDSEVIGAINSDNFISFQPVTQCFLRTDERQGEFVSYNGSLYRDRWMKPIVWQAEFIQTQITEITQEEYDAIIAAIEHDEEIIIDDGSDDEDPIIPPPDDAELDIILEFIRESKIRQMSNDCRKAIESGFDLTLRGETHHFSLSTQDQLNLMSLGTMAQTQSIIPYHADGEECVFYTSEEINEIIATANSFKVYHTTYFNALKNYINALSTIEEISAIEYGVEIPEEYKTDVLKVLEG